MAIIRNTATLADGITPARRADVKIARLSYPRYEDGRSIIWHRHLTAGPDTARQWDPGYWETDQIPAGLYIVTEKAQRVGARPVGERIAVPDSAATFWLTELIDGDLTEDELTAFALHLVASAERFASIEARLAVLEALSDAY